MWSRSIGALVLVALLSPACIFDGAGLGGRPVISADAAPDLPAPDTGEIEAEAGGDAPPQLSCVEQQCPLGCNKAEDRCFLVMPSNIDPRGFHDVATRAVVLQSAGVPLVIDADTGAIPGYRKANDPSPASGGVYWSIKTLQDGSEVAVFAMDGLRVVEETSVRIIGSRPVILYVRRQVEIAGTLSVAAAADGPGPGGRAGGPLDGQQGDPMCPGSGRGGDQLDEFSYQWESGGGGGGYGAMGARGGTVRCNVSTFTREPALGGGGGDAFGDASLVPLRGGCGGGAGGGPDQFGVVGAGGAGGGGGGALQITAGEKLTITAKGGVDAAGAGGRGGQSGAAGGGGGSGGAVLLEAPVLQIDGTVAANGGGGGAGSGYGTLANTGAPGDPGQLSGTQAAGGQAQSLVGIPLLGTDGGKGGASVGVASTGVDSDDLCNGGGGGGGVGRVRLNSNSQPGGKISPSASVGPLLPPW
jgi:hypothetical protein